MSDRPADPERTVHLVTVLYNSAAVIGRFRDNLLAQTHREWRLLAIDNASTDGSADMLAQTGDPRIAIARNAGNLGFARAANIGMRRALDDAASFVVLINNDVQFAPDFLRSLLDARDALGADVLTPRINYLRDPADAWYAGGHFDRSWVFTNVHENRASTEPDIVEFASGCCLGLSRRAIERAGMFDERFFVYWEDSDFCLRLHKAGLPIHYAPGCVLLHDASKLSGGAGSPRYLRLYHDSYMRFLDKHFGTAYASRSALRLLAKHARERAASGGPAWPHMASGMVRGLGAALLFRCGLRPAMSEPGVSAGRSR